MTAVAYGDTARVAALCQMWTRDGEWYDPVAYDLGPPEIAEVIGTNPTLTQVSAWLTQTSAMMDLAMSDVGFIVPVLVPAAIAAIGPYIEGLTADLCHAANSSGRFFTERIIERGMSVMIVVQQNINGWVKDNTQGLKNLGVPFIGQESPITSFSIPPSKQL